MAEFFCFDDDGITATEQNGKDGGGMNSLLSVQNIFSSFLTKIVDVVVEAMNTFNSIWKTALLTYFRHYEYITLFLFRLILELSNCLQTISKTTVDFATRTEL